MVFLKVSDGYETRKLQLTGELSLDQLKQQLNRFFPRLSGNNFSLQYRDEDGDLITLSTDEELQAVLAALPQDAVWRVQLRENTTSETSSSLFDRLFEPHWRPFGLFSWHDHHRRLREAEELARERQRQRERALQEQRRTLLEQRKKAEAEKEKAKEGTKDEVKSKKSDPAPGYKYHRYFGFLEPTVYESPFGHLRVTVISPTGCHAWWSRSGSGSEEQSKSETTEKSETEATEKSQTEATEQLQSQGDPETTEPSPSEPQQHTAEEAQAAAE